MDREMSESSKRGETTAGSDDKQKMIKELKGMKMYEAGMSTKEMEMLINAVKESKMPSQTLTSNASNRNSASPELSPNRYANTSEKNDSSEENIFTPTKRNSYVKDTQNMNKNRLSINENPTEPNENKRLTRINSQLRNEDKIPKWKINPLDFIVNDKDSPLESRFSSTSSSSSFYNRDDNEYLKNSHNIDMAIGQISIHLQNISDSRRYEKWNQYISTWGIGIKATILDEKEHVDEGNEIIEASTSKEENIDELPSGRKRRACVKLQKYNEIIDDNNSDEDYQITEKKRKSNTLENVKNENSLKREDSYNFESLLDDESDDDEMKNHPKKIKIQEKILFEDKEKNHKNIDEKKNHLENKNKTFSHDNSDDVTIYDVESREFNKLKKNISDESTTSVYPRRIIPPNPSTKYSGIRARKPLHKNLQVKGKKNDFTEEKEMLRDKNKIGLYDDEISALLTEDEEIDEATSSEKIIIRPARISNRLKNQCEILKAESKKDEEIENIRKQEKKFQEEAAERLKQERVRQRIRHEAEKLKAEELFEKRKLSMQEQWRSKFKAKEKEKLRQCERTELNPEGPRNSNDIVEVMVENSYAEDENEARMVDNRDENSPYDEMPCPICGKKFPVGEIEAHAASCEEYEATSSVGSRSNSPALPTTSRILTRNHTELFECVTCSNYRAKDGRDFEQHVKNCLSRLKDGEGSTGERSDVIVTVPDSPIRSLRRTSELTDSEINYTNQFVPKTRSQKNTGVKRKR